MTTDRPDPNSDTCVSNTILVEIVCEGGPPTPEDLARPRYGRPSRPELRADSERTDEGQAGPAK